MKIPWAVLEVKDSLGEDRGRHWANSGGEVFSNLSEVSNDLSHIDVTSNGLSDGNSCSSHISNDVLNRVSTLVTAGCAKSATVEETVRAVFPAHWANSIIVSLAIRIAESSIVLLLLSAS